MTKPIDQLTKDELVDIVDELADSHPAVYELICEKLGIGEDE